MRVAGFLLFVLATMLLSLLDGFGASAAAFVLCSSGSALIVRRQLAELADRELEQQPLRISVVRWNY
jgi:hypothetical protein